MKKAKFFKVTFLSLMSIFCFSFATVEHRPTLYVEVLLEGPLAANQEFETDLYYTYTNRLCVYWRDNEASWDTGVGYEIPIPESTKNIADESLVCFINSIEVSNVAREFVFVAESTDPTIIAYKRGIISTTSDNI